ncbi:MAG: hypothetical protein OEZ04_05250 [Nitrospinota bacterium]|nr:hypothetical protein [Nitrospinota bacterium]
MMGRILPKVALALLLMMAVAQAAPQGQVPQELVPQGQASQGQAQGADENISQKRQLLSEILQRPVYQRWKLRQSQEAEPQEESVIAQMARSALQSIWNGFKRIIKWIWKQIKRSNISLPDLPSAPGNMLDFLKMGAWAAFAALLVVAGLYLYGIRKKLRDNIRLAVVLSREKVKDALENGQALALDADGWMTEADRMGAEGDFRAMYRAMYLGLLSGLHESGRIDFRKNRTNWVYVNGYKGSLADRADFSALTETFDQVWYGLKPAEGVSLEEVKAMAGRLLSGRLMAGRGKA